MKVRLLDGTEEKGTAQVEQELLEKHEQQFQDVRLPGQEPRIETPIVETQEIVIQQEPAELDEQQVLSYIGKRYNKQINSLDELTAQREEAEALPEDVAAYMKYKKETGRGFEDFLSLKKDFDSMDSESLLKNYLSATQEGLDADDIDSLMDDYRYDEDIDDESHIKRVKITQKRRLLRQRNFLMLKKNNTKCHLSQVLHSFLMRRKKFTKAISNIPSKRRLLSRKMKEKEIGLTKNLMKYLAESSKVLSSMLMTRSSRLLPETLVS